MKNSIAQVTAGRKKIKKSKKEEQRRRRQECRTARALKRQRSRGLDEKVLHKVSKSAFGKILHHKQVLSLALATLGVIYTVKMTIHAIGTAMAGARGKVPKFGINDLVEGTRPAPLETQATWNHLLQLKPDAVIEVHAHYTREDFTRSIGMHDKASMPQHMQEKAAAIEEALEANYHSEPLDNRKVLIDPRESQHNVYGDQHVAEQAGTIRTFLQAIPDSIEAHAADVREMVETVASALLAWRSKGE